MTNVQIHKLPLGHGQLYARGLLETVNASLEALVLDVDPVFPLPELLPVFEWYKDHNIPVFLISGQHALYEQQELRKKLSIASRLGAIDLGAYDTSRPENVHALVSGFQKIFDGKSGSADKINAAIEQFYKPAIDDTEFSQIIEFLENGGSLDLSKFIYTDYHKWLEIRNSPHYKPLADACEASFIASAPAIRDAMLQRGLLDYYSFGPTPHVDAQILAEFVRAKQQVRYHPIDVSVKALGQTRNTIEQYLETVDTHWKNYVELADEKPRLFSNVNTTGPVAVVYTGGQIANDENFLPSASQICKEGGLVIADVHTRNPRRNEPHFWKYIYDIDEEKAMFRRAIELLVPHLAAQKGWDVEVKYVCNPDGPDRISFQLKVDREITTYCNMVEVVLKPESQVSMLPASMIHSYRNAGLPIPEGKVVKPRELQISKKYSENQFIQEVQKNGYELISTCHEPIRINAQGGGSVMTSILEYRGINKRNWAQKTEIASNLLKKVAVSSL